ncbi:MAG: sugar phosphate nucleotidyltransferase [Patescibacteria group bacterium]
MNTRPTVLILAAGENSRFFPFNTAKHKAALEMLGEPLIVRTLRNLQENHFSDVVIVVSEKDYGGKGLSVALQRYDLDLKISFVLQSKPLGGGDAVLCAQEHLRERFFVINPYYVGVGEVLERLLKESTQNVLAATETDRPWEYGIFELDGERVVGIIEKPEVGTEPSRLKNEVLHLLGQEFLSILKNLPSEQNSYEKALDHLIKKTTVGIVKLAIPLASLKYPWHLFDYQSLLFSRTESSTAIDAHVSPTAVIDDTKGPVVIESGAYIGHAVKLLGPCYIGRHAYVGDFSFIRGASLEEGVVIGSNTEVARSIFFPHSDIHFGYIADSIVGVGVTIGAGLITANKRHDRENVLVEVKGRKVDCGANRLGAMFGDGAKIGVRTTTMPGVIVGAAATVFPSMTVYKNVESGAVLK